MATRLLAALLLIAAPAAAQTAAPPAKPGATTVASPSAAAATAPASTPAPMPDPMVSPDLQPAQHAPTFDQFVQQSSWQDQVIDAARAQYKQLPGACAAAKFNPTGKLVLYIPPRFSADGKLDSGMWSQGVAVSGCAPLPDQLNVLTVVQPGKPPTRIPTMPGDSHADPQTQKNALQYAEAIAIRAAPAGCTHQIFTDAKFDGYTGLPAADVPQGRDNRAWREAWYLFACSNTYVIEMTFVPNAQGIQLSATNPVKQPG